MHQNDNHNNTTPNYKPDHLTVFTFLWACQALVHQEFYSAWLDERDIFGWLLIIAAVATLLKPRSLLLFSTMLITSAVYNINKWPYVVNHILMETIINLTILGAIATVMIGNRGKTALTREEPRKQIYDRFAPVLTWMLIIMYYFALIAKLNYDFIDPELSCVEAMYGDLMRRAPFLPTALWAKYTAIWSTIVIEAAIPLLLTFRRTRYLGVALGLPFHLMLGLVGHRTFSGLAYAAYSLFLMEPLTVFLGEVGRRVHQRFGAARIAQFVVASRIVVVVSFASLIGADLAGHYRSGIGPLLIFRIPWVIWIMWSLVISAIYFKVMWLHHQTGESRRTELIPFYAPTQPEGSESMPRATTRPGFLWAVLALIFLNGLSQYLGLKTETCFTMYSNLRTEGNVNNHMFMPALRLANYQDDLVEIIETDHHKLTKYVKEDLLITYFELHRALSKTQEDCTVTFRRAGEVHVFRRRDRQSTHPELTQLPPLWLAKLLYFRPVPKGDRMPCQH